MKIVQLTKKWIKNFLFKRKKKILPKHIAFILNELQNISLSAKEFQLTYIILSFNLTSMEIYEKIKIELEKNQYFSYNSIIEDNSIYIKLFWKGNGDKNEHKRDCK